MAAPPSALTGLAASALAFLLLLAGLQTWYAWQPASAAIEPAPAPADTPAAPPEPPPSTSAALIVADWRPDLRQTVEQLEELVASDLPQQELNFTLANLNAVYDALLFVKFTHRLADLEPVQRTPLLQSQQAWLQQRRELATQAFNEYGGGSLASYHAGEVFLQMTRQRLAELQEQP